MLESLENLMRLEMTNDQKAMILPTLRPTMDAPTGRLRTTKSLILNTVAP